MKNAGVIVLGSVALAALAALQPDRCGAQLPAASQPVAPAGTHAATSLQHDSQLSTAAQAGTVAPSTAAQIAPQKQMPQPQLPQPTVVLKPGEVPGIEFDTPQYEFGKAKAGGEIEHDFWFTNTGNGPLEILSVKPS